MQEPKPKRVMEYEMRLYHCATKSSGMFKSSRITRSSTVFVP
nr:MAG TPA: hypothetical protein [Caudoviricetes sp.]